MSRAASSWGLRFRLRERLEQSWLLIPGAYVAAALALGTGIPRIDAGDAVRVEFAQDSALDILQAVASGMLAFSALVVSVAVLVVQFGAGQYTPRLVLRFRRDPSFKHSLGIFIAPAIYALVSLGHIGGTSAARTPALTVTVAIALLVGAVFAFFTLVARLLDLLRPRRLYALLRAGGERAINQVYPDRHDDGATLVELPAAPVVESISWHGDGGVLSAVDLPLLVREARRQDVTVELTVRVGEYVRHASEVMRVRGHAPAQGTGRLRRALIVSEERTITQDPAYAIRTIVDIAIRALSPAVNDPTTAVQALDVLESLLHQLALRDLGRGGLTDADGTVRVVYAAAGWDELLDLSLTEIRAYGVGSHQVTRRLAALLLTLRQHAPESRAQSTERHLDLLRAAVARAHPEREDAALALVPDRSGLGGRLPAPPPAPTRPAS